MRKNVEFVKKIKERGIFIYKNKTCRPRVLDGRKKKCYHSSMENYNEMNKQIAQNLSCYRKAAGYTQAELAEKINYSDKSISKWEQGNGVPDIYVLTQLARLYGVTIDELVGEDAEQKVKERKQRQFGYHIFIMLLSSGIIWLIATCVFVSMQMWKPLGIWWVVFIYAVTVNAVLLVVYASIWRYRWLNFVSTSLLIWTAITSVFFSILLFSANRSSIWMLFLLGAPLQVLEVWWVFFRSYVSNHNKKKSRKTEEGVGTLSNDGGNEETVVEQENP